jgi:hypothetical protein
MDSSAKQPTFFCEPKSATHEVSSMNAFITAKFVRKLPDHLNYGNVYGFLKIDINSVIDLVLEATKPSNPDGTLA